MPHRERQDQREQREPPRTDELERLVDLSVDMLCVGSMSGRFELLNPAWSLTLGYGEHELRGRKALELVHPDDVEPSLAEGARLTQPGHEIKGFETRFKHKDGSYRWLSWSIRTDGEHLYALARDVTDGRAAYEALRESEERLRTMVQTTHEGIWQLDAEDRTTWVNARMAQMLGYTPEEMIGRPVYDFIEPHGHRAARRRLEARRRGESDQHELTFLRKDGAAIWTILSGSPLTDADGSYAGAFAMVTDISRRKRQEQAVRASEERYRNIIETTSEGVWMIDADHRTTYVNRRMASMLGYTVEEMLGRPVQDFEPDEDAEAGEQPAAPAEHAREVRYRRKDGSVLWGLMSSSPLTDGSGAYGGALAMIADITERKHAEEAQARLAAIVKSSPDAIFSTDMHGLITSWNAAAERLYGYSEQEMLGRPSLSLAAPGTEDHIRQITRALLDGEQVIAFETRAVTSDGRMIDVCPSVSLIETPDGRTIGTLAIVRGS